MDNTAQGTGVLLYVAVKSRKASVFAGPGIHAAARPGFWQEVIDTLANRSRGGDLKGGLIEAVNIIGDLLRKEVPGTDTAGNELPNKISES